MIIIFLIYAQSIDCRYSLQPPYLGSSYKCPQSMFKNRNMNKKNYNMILLCYKKGRATVFTDINF